MSTDIIEATPTAVATMPVRSVSTADRLLELAVQQGADLDKLERLMDLKQRHDADVARAAYNVAFAAFKAEAVKIVRNRKVTDGPLKGKSYAELHAVVNAITPALSKHGLSMSWRITKDERDWLEVTCTLKHEAGHIDAVSMGGPPDTGGAKNAIQARASTVSYLERYTAKAITGLSEQDDDDDGQGGARHADISALLVGLGAMTTDATALSYWNTHKVQLAGDKAASDAFKKAVVEHRINLKRGAP